MRNTNINIIPELFATTISIVAGILMFLSRFGFENNGLLIIKSILISIFVIFVPHYLTIKLIKIIGERWYVSKGFILLLCIAVLVLFGSININLNIDISFFIMLIGVTVFLVVVMPYLKEINMRIIFIKFPLFMIFALFVTTSYSEGRYWNPLMKEKIITGAWAHREAIFHASISEMIKTYNVVSTGIDGLVPLHYHIFSHFLYGSVSGLLKTNSINFYNIVVPIIFIPLFFLSFVWCVNEVRGYYTRKYNYKIINEYYNSYWITLIVVFAFQDAHYNYPTAGSHGTALLLTFILIATTFRAVNKIKPESKPIAQTSDIILIIFVVICYLCISYSKISFIYLIGICYGYLFIRLKLYNSLFHKLTILGLCLVVVYMYLFLIVPLQTSIPEVNYSKNVGLFVYYKSIMLEYLFSIYPSIVYILLKLFCLRINSVLILFKNVHNANLIDIELLIILMIMSFVPPYPHFHLMQMSIASILLLSHLGLFQERLFGSKRRVQN